MVHDIVVPSTQSETHELAALRKEWWWFLLLGLLLIISGSIAISYAFLASVAVITLFGFLLVLGGIAQLVAAFWIGRWSGLAISMLTGILYIVVGGLTVARPGEALEAMTLLIGAFLLIGGIFRSVAAMTLRLHHWGWLLLNGLITVLLGLTILAEWPGSSFFVIGLFVGIDMLFNGWAWVMLSLGLRSIPEPAK